MQKLVCGALLSAALLASASVQAADTVKRGGFLVQLDLDMGGDDLAHLEFTDGESQDVKAGQGVAFGVGGYVRPVESVSFEIQGIIGYKVVFTAADNADIKVTRTMFQLNGIYRFANDWYAGGGYTRHMGIKLDGDGFFDDFEFDDASGFTAEFGWRWVGLHYTKMDYSSPGYEDADASHVGIRFTHLFGGK
jgi:hypothetical protein